MSDTAVLVNTAVAILAIAVLIVRFKLNPLIALVVGCRYLGISAGLGVDRTIKAVGDGFGDTIAGLYAAFGVLMSLYREGTGPLKDRVVDVALYEAVSP